MFYFYHVWLIDETGRKVKHIDTLKCLSSSIAEEECYMKFGSTSKLSGWSRNNFKAEKC